MFQIIYIPTNTLVSSYALLADAEQALSVIETNPPSHEITNEPESIELMDVIADGDAGE